MTAKMSSKIPIVLRNRTRFPLVFRYKSPHHLAFHKVTDDAQNPQTLEAGGVLMVDTDPGATWEASIPSSDYVYGSQWVQPYKFMGVNVPANVQQGQVFDISESLFVNREPAPGGMTGAMTGAHPTQVVPMGQSAMLVGNGTNGQTIALISGGIAAGIVLILIMALILWWYNTR